MKAFLVSVFAGLAAASGITLQLFDGPSCNQDILQPDKVVQNVNSNGGTPDGGSGCVAASFQSAKFVKFSPGFKCNIYTDSQCGDFSASIDAADACDSFPGSSVLCFDQGILDNAFANSQVSVTIGSQEVATGIHTDSLVKQGIQAACGDNGCDPTNISQQPYQHFNQDGQTTVSVTGSYSNTDQRDYMKELMVQIVGMATHDKGVDLTGSFVYDQGTANQFTFFQIVIRDQNGNIQAQMTATFNTTTQKQKPGDCGIVGTIEKLAISEIPAVGGLAAQAFDFVCQKAG